MFKHRLVLDVKVDDNRDYRFECPPIEEPAEARIDEMCMVADELKKHFSLIKKNYLKDKEEKALIEDQDKAEEDKPDEKVEEIKEDE